MEESPNLYLGLTRDELQYYNQIIFTKKKKASTLSQINEPEAKQIKVSHDDDFELPNWLAVEDEIKRLCDELEENHKNEESILLLSRICSSSTYSISIRKEAIPTLINVLKRTKIESLLMEILKALTAITQSQEDQISNQIAKVEDIVPTLVTLVCHPNVSVASNSLRLAGMISCTSDENIEALVGAGILTTIKSILEEPSKLEFYKECCWTISNITASSEKLIQMTIDAKLLPTLLNLGKYCLRDDVRAEAFWALANITGVGSMQQLESLCTEEFIHIMVREFASDREKIIKVGMEALENLLASASSSSIIYKTLKEHENEIIRSLKEDISNAEFDKTVIEDLTERAQELIDIFSELKNQ